MSNATTIQFTSLASTLTVKPAALTSVSGVSVARMNSNQASIAMAIEAALKGSK
jgi:hypothetical protein